jgi:hypothetical protein
VYRHRCDGYCSDSKRVAVLFGEHKSADIPHGHLGSFHSRQGKSATPLVASFLFPRFILFPSISHAGQVVGTIMAFMLRNSLFASALASLGPEPSASVSPAPGFGASAPHYDADFPVAAGYSAAAEAAPAVSDEGSGAGVGGGYATYQS